MNLIEEVPEYLNWFL